jgi:hypothetical protein
MPGLIEYILATLGFLMTFIVVVYSLFAANAYDRYLREKKDYQQRNKLYPKEDPGTLYYVCNYFWWSCFLVGLVIAVTIVLGLIGYHILTTIHEFATFIERWYHSSDKNEL